MYKAVIFDMDGVIIDSEPIHFKMDKETHKYLGIKLSEEEHHSFVGTTSQHMWNLIKEKYRLTQSLEEHIELERSTYLKFFLENCTNIAPINGVVKFIMDLHRNGVKLGIASSSPMVVIQTIVDIFNLDKYFDAIITGDLVEKSKPEPDIFLFAAKELNVEPENCIVIEDSYNGIMASIKAGMKSVGYINFNSGY